MPGRDRHPSSPGPEPFSISSSGLINTSGDARSSLTSRTITRLCTSTWVAARPTPLAEYMVSSRLSMNWRSASSTSPTGAAFLRSLGSGYSRITSFVMGVMRAISCFWLKNVAKVPPLLNLMPVLVARARPAKPQKRAIRLSLGGRPAVYQSASDIKLKATGAKRMQGHQIIALTLSVAVLAGCRTERPVTAPVPVAAPESAVQGTVVGDDRTAMEAAVDAGPSTA